MDQVIPKINENHMNQTNLRDFGFRVDVPVFSVWIRMGRIAKMCNNYSSTLPDIAQKMLVVFPRDFPPYIDDVLRFSFVN